MFEVDMLRRSASKMLYILVLCPALLAAVQTLTIDSELGTSIEDCFERISIGEQLPPDAIYRNVTELTTRECEQICKQDKQCQSYDYGVGAKGNATCNFGKVNDKEINEKNKLIRNPDYDVYVRRFQCEQSPPSPINPQFDAPDDNPNKPVFRPGEDQHPLKEDYLISGDVRPYGFKRPVYQNERPDDYTNTKPDYDMPPSYGSHTPQDIPYRPARPDRPSYNNSTKPDPYDVLQFQDPYRPARPGYQNHNRPPRPYVTDKPEYIYIVRPNRPKPSDTGYNKPTNDYPRPGYGQEDLNHKPGPSKPYQDTYGPEPSPSYGPRPPYEDNTIQVEIYNPPRPYGPPRPTYGQGIFGYGTYSSENSYLHSQYYDDVNSGYNSDQYGPPRPDPPYNRPGYPVYGKPQTSYNDKPLYGNNKPSYGNNKPIYGQGGYGSNQGNNQNDYYSNHVNSNQYYNKPHGNDDYGTRPTNNNQGYGSNQSSYNDQTTYGSTQVTQNTQSSYGGHQDTYHQEQASYGSSTKPPVDSQSSYGNQDSQNSGYGSQNSQSSGYGSQSSQNSGYGDQSSQNSDYGSQKPQNSGYGSLSSQESGYGSQSSQNSGYGSQSNQNSGYGSLSSQESGYGSQSSQNSGYGSQSNQNSGYGSQSSQNSGYVSQNSQNSAYGSQSIQNSGYGSLSSQNSGYGSQNSQSSGYGSQSSQNSGYGGQSSQNSGYGSQNTQNSDYGSSQVSGYGSQSSQDSLNSYGKPPKKPNSNQNSYGGNRPSYAYQDTNYGTYNKPRPYRPSYGNRYPQNDYGNPEYQNSYGGYQSYGNEGYGSSQNYGSSQGYGSTQSELSGGYGSSQNYGSTQGYGSSQSYGGSQGYGGSHDQGYGGSQSSYGTSQYGSSQTSQSQSYGSQGSYGSQTSHGSPNYGSQNDKPYKPEKPQKPKPTYGQNDEKPSYGNPGKPGITNNPGYDDNRPDYIVPGANTDQDDSGYGNDKTKGKPGVKPVYENDRDRPGGAPSYIAKPGGEVVTSRPVAISEFDDPGRNPERDFSYKACFRRVLAGKRTLRSHVRKVVPCETLEDCRRECAEERRFPCESFNYRLDRAFRGKGLCELMTKPIEALDIRRDFVEDKDFDFYELDRNSLEPNCPDTLRGPGYLHSGFLSSKNRIPEQGWQDRNDRWDGRFRNRFEDKRRYGNRYETRFFVPYQINPGLARNSEEDQENWGQYGGQYGSYDNYYKNSDDFHKSINYWRTYDHEPPIYGVKPYANTNFDYHNLGRNGSWRYGYGSWKRGRWAPRYNGGNGELEDKSFDEPIARIDEGRTKDCSSRRSPGMSLGTGAIRRSLVSRNVVECEAACFSEREFKCVSYSYRYSNSRESDNCYLSERPYRGLELSADSSSDVYAMPQDQDCTTINYKPWVESECFWHVRSGAAVDSSAVRAALTVAGLGACEAECIRAQNFFCRGFSFRFDSPTIGDDLENCILTSSPPTSLENGHGLRPNSGHELYARGNYGRGCEPALYDDIQHKDEECYLQYDKAAKLTGAAIRGQARVADERACGITCNEAPFRCLSFSFNNNAPPDKDNCLLSEIRLFDLKRDVDYVHSADDWLFAFDLFNGQCWRKVHHSQYDEPTPEIPRPISPPQEYIEPSGPAGPSVHNSVPPSGRPERPLGPPVVSRPSQSRPYIADHHDSHYIPASGPSGPEYSNSPPFKPNYPEPPPYKHFRPRPKPTPDYVPNRPDFTPFSDEDYNSRPGPSFKPIYPSDSGFKPAFPPPVKPKPNYPPGSRPGYLSDSEYKPFRPFRPAADRGPNKPDYLPGYFEEKPGYLANKPEYLPNKPGYLVDKPGYLADLPGYLPDRTPGYPSKRPYDDPRPGSERPGYPSGGNIEPTVSWRHYTVSGFPCRSGSTCAQNTVAGHWACEPEGGEVGSWDYCCAPTHRCGYSEGFHKPWCYVGPNEDQWRPCSEKYYPYHQHKEPHPSQVYPGASGHQDPPRPWQDKPYYKPGLSEADRKYWDDLYQNGPQAYYDKYGNPLPGYARVPTAEGPHIKFSHNYPPPSTGQWLEVPQTQDGPPTALGVPRYWPVAYLHKGPPPNTTYFTYNETKTTTEKYPTTERHTTTQPTTVQPQTDDKHRDVKQRSNFDDDKPEITTPKVTTPKPTFTTPITTTTTTTTTTTKAEVNVDTVKENTTPEVELVKPETVKVKETRNIDDKLGDLNTSIEVLDLDDVKGDKISDVKTLEAEERQIEEIGRILASRRGGKLVLDTKTQKDLEAKSIAIDKDSVDYNFGNRFNIERRGIIQKVTKEEIEKERADKSLEVSETTYVRPPRVLSTTENIRKAVVNGKVFYDATIREQRDIYNTTRRSKNLRSGDETKSFNANINSGFQKNKTLKDENRLPNSNLTSFKFRNLRNGNESRVLNLNASANYLKFKNLRLEESRISNVNSSFGKKVIKPRNVNPVRRARRVYRKRYNPDEVRRRLLEREKSKQENSASQKL